MNDKKGGERLQLLLLPYTPARFLINRFQCSSSVYIADTKERREEDTRPWLKETLLSGEMELPLFDFDAFLHHSFSLQGHEPARLALIRPFETFSAPVREKCVEFGLSEKEALAFRVSSSTRMIDLGPDDFHLPPSGLAGFLQLRGIPALSLPDEDHLSFLIDFDKLFELAILEGTG